MKNRMIVNEMIAILLVLWSGFPAQNIPALERSTTIAVSLVDGSPYFLGELNGELYYKFQLQLWKTDGEPDGTLPLGTAVPLGPHLGPSDYPGSPFHAHHYPKGESANGIFFFSASDTTHGSELWRSDGTPAGTYMLKDIYPGNDSSFSSNFKAISNLVFFTTSVDDYYSAIELWRSDGTAGGTFMLTTLPSSSLQFASVNGLLLFNKESDVWVSDGTVAGTSFLITGFAQFFGETEGKLFFSTTSDHYLWVTDGTMGGTLPLTDFLVSFHACDSGQCYFSESTTSGPKGLWVTDGTASGTVHLMVDFPITFYACTAGLCFFAETTSDGADGVWVTDGTPSGTSKLADVINPIWPLSDFETVDGTIYFNLNNELWKTDGTAVTTGMVIAFDTDQTISDIVVLNGELLLKVEEPRCSEYLCSQDWHLYKSDGTQTGTHRMGDFAQTLLNCPTPLCSAFSIFVVNSTVIDGKWFFEALDSVSYTPKLWVITNVFFQDVAPDHWAFPWVERLADAGMTGGCTPDQYCPHDPVTRGQIAVFLEKGIHYPIGFTPPDAPPTFADTAGHWAEDWIETLRSDGITGGCAPNLYCPEDPVTRAQMAVFLLKSKHGSGYTPPAIGAGTGFTDVPGTHWAAPWIKQLAVEGITGGCGTGIYCPESSVTRAQMAVFLVRTFGLP